MTIKSLAQRPCPRTADTSTAAVPRESQQAMHHRTQASSNAQSHQKGSMDELAASTHNEDERLLIMVEATIPILNENHHDEIETEIKAGEADTWTMKDLAGTTQITLRGRHVGQEKEVEHHHNHLLTTTMRVPTVEEEGPRHHDTGRVSRHTRGHAMMVVVV